MKLNSTFMLFSGDYYSVNCNIFTEKSQIGAAESLKGLKRYKSQATGLSVFYNKLIFFTPKIQ